ncbi:conserved hypothetical protein [Stackebrandtia nassauensis DSM 44728]|uniref:Polyhydroxyalkanoate synthesis regulator phasin n=2 Tax=Stackebrandtia TaxID=283810 RepID=D3Q537_STANL|nr:conserved hypothetical protein [Stackebrandtia nassauensis DSM 44728]
MQDAWRAYLELALGLTEASRKKATQIIKSLAEQSGEKVEDLQGMAQELLSQGMANRENVVKLVQFELDKALDKVGLATKDEVADLKSRVRQLEEELRQARRQSESGEPSAAKPAKKTVKKAAAKKTTAKKATAKKVVKKTAKKTAKKAAKGE